MSAPHLQYEAADGSRYDHTDVEEECKACTPPSERTPA